MDEDEVSPRSLLKALKICIQNNYFSFNDKIYHQKGGVGTGIKLAPPFACLGVGDFEEKFFSSENDLVKMILLWKRYIDDVFALLKGEEEDCKNLVDFLNTLLPGVIKFTSKFSKEKIEFLDLEISIEEGKLETNLYIKPSNLQLYLDYFSNHPQHCNVGLVYSLALRIIERCSKQKDVDLHLENLKGKLSEKNYPENVINKQFERAKLKDRKELINKPRPPKLKDDGKTRLIFTHNASNPHIHQWVREAKQLLVRNDKAILLGESIQITSRQPRNLQRMVTGIRKGGRGAPPLDAGCHKCNKCKVACPVLIEGTHFKSTNTGKTYPIRKRLDCTSDHVIYLVTCAKCCGQYVGKSTTDFKRRHSNHKVEIRNQRGGLGHHFGGQNGCGYQNVKIMLIDQVEKGDKIGLENCEVYWQNQMRCYVENGGGGCCYRKEKMKKTK
jgi:hypothetical protein